MNLRLRWKIIALALLVVVSILGIYDISSFVFTISAYSSNNEQAYYEFLEQYDYNSSNLVDMLEVNETQDYEMTQHQLHEQIKDLWNYASNGKRLKIKNAIAETDIEKSHRTMQTLLSNLKNRKRSLDGRAEWRERDAAIASDLVQRRLQELHDPPDCKAARKIICYLNYKCGFGCYVHHIAYCLKVAYITNRLVMLDQDIWRYKPSWRSLFEPLSVNCTNTPYNLKKAVTWPLKGSSKAQLVYVKDKANMPLGIPEDLANRVMGFNADPGAWFMGQIMKYILRPRQTFQKIIDDSIARTTYQNPVVGLHVRRTDKLIQEAKFHPLKEYMQHVEDYWIAQDVARRPGTPPTPRRVYLACDDVTVFEEARRMYPQVEFLGDKNISSSASVKNRWSAKALTGIVVDLILLSRADYLVCTFSSNVGRAAYELMQTNRVDASESYVSLDNTYHFFGNYQLRVKQGHKAQRKEEMSLEIGDLIKTGIENDFKGYGRGKALNKNQTGLFPRYKVEYFPMLYRTHDLE